MLILLCVKMTDMFKILTLSGVINKAYLIKNTFYDEESVNIDDTRIKCLIAGGHGSKIFLDEAQNSCNLGFVELERLCLIIFISLIMVKRWVFILLSNK